MEKPAPCEALPLGTLADAFEALQTLAAEPFDGASAVGVIRLSQWAHPHYARYLETRDRVAAAHGERVAEGRYHILPENVAAYDRAMAPTRAESVEFDRALQIPVAGLASIRISPRTLSTLLPFVAGL